MNRKRILGFLFAFTLVAISVLYVLANRTITKIFGGRTTEVVSASFLPEVVPTLINNIHLLSPDGESFIPQQSILLQDGLIVAIDSVLEAPEGATVIDGTGKFLIPGLIDSHVHLYQSPNDLLLYLANGVTEIREMDGRDPHLRWREEVAAGLRAGPDMYLASPRTGSFDRLEGWFIHWTQGMRVINDREDAQELVDEMAAKGYDGIKIYSQLSKEAYAAINELAPAAGLDVLGHIPFTLELETLLQSNQREVAHLEELMRPTLTAVGGPAGIKDQAGADAFLSLVEERMEEAAPRLAERGIAVTTTLWLMESFVRQLFDLEQLLSEVELAYENPGFSEWQEQIPGLGWLPKVNRYKNRFGLNKTPQEQAELTYFWTAYADGCRTILSTLHANGVTILAGTDANVPVAVPGFSLHDEMRSMHRVGMTPRAVLQSATRLPGEWLGRRTGSLREGYKANVVVLAENPLLDINHTRGIQAVIANGRYFDRATLDEMLRAVKAANDASRTIDIKPYVE